MIDEATIAPNITTAKTTPAAAPRTAGAAPEPSETDPAHRPPAIAAITGTSRKARYPGAAFSNSTSPLDTSNRGNRP